jgi:endonuclease I
MIKKLYILVAILVAATSYGQIPAYYSDVNLTLTGIPLKDALASKITNTHNSPVSYSQVWTVLQSSDLDPINSANVLLVYGYDDNDGNETTDRSRSKNASGGANTNEWNREHTYPKSLATPALSTGSPSAGTDAHNLKPADVDNNGVRGNKKFAAGSGNGGVVGANWYPGDEWKGDVARIYMYMYVRYTAQCKPGNACVGNPIAIDLNMVDILLDWNAQDPVNAYEQNRNNIIYNNQGNRNPFIDNPYLATLIWGGITAQNFWEEVSIEEKELELNIYPNPTENGIINFNINDYYLVNSIEIFDISGKIIKSISSSDISSKTQKIENLDKGVYFAKISTSLGVLTKKIVVK